MTAERLLNGILNFLAAGLYSVEYERNEQGDHSSVTEICITLCNNCLQTELSDSECDCGEDESEDSVAAEVTLCSCFIVGHATLDGVYAAGNDTGDHVNCSGDSAEYDKQRNDGGKNACTNTVLNQNQHGNGGLSHLGNVGNCKQADDGKFHSAEVADEHPDSSLVDLLGVGNGLHVLVHYRYGSKLEEEIKNCRPECGAECAAHLGAYNHFAVGKLADRFSNCGSLSDDVGNKNDYQTYNDKNTKGGSALSNHVGAVKSNQKDEDANDYGADHVRNTGEGIDGRTAGSKSSCRSGADHDEIADLVKVGHDWSGLAVDAVGEAAVVVSLVLISITHAIPEEEGIETLSENGQEQAPDTVVDKVLVDLRAGSEAAAELGGECNECDTHNYRHFALVN